jgi:hypothetical protein
MKTCYACDLEKPLVNYHVDKKSKDGRSNRCKVCAKESTSKWRAENPERARAKVKECFDKNRKKYYSTHNDRQLFVKYGLTRVEYERLLEETLGVCVVCSRPFGTSPYTKPVVDHCHTTGKTRGIICRQCNIGLGAFKDNTNALNNAVKYLNGEDID